MSFAPAWAAPPGQTVQQTIDSQGLDETDVRERLGLSDSEFEKLLRGDLRIGEDLSEAMSRELGGSRQFWADRDRIFLSDLERVNSLDPTKEMATWSKRLPVQSMKKYGWISRHARGRELRDELLAFFGCDDFDGWKTRYDGGIGAVAFRSSFSFDNDHLATHAWLRAGERQLNGRSDISFNKSGFLGALQSIRKLTFLKHPRVFWPKLKKVCEVHGVQLAWAKTPKGCHASGATWINETGQPVILVSFRHLAEDHFWFTFFHEAAHVVLHGGAHIDAVAGDPQFATTQAQEDEANEFARNLLIPPSHAQELIGIQPTKGNVRAFARKVSITPGIIVGQLQSQKRVTYDKLNFLKRRYRWQNEGELPDAI